MAKPWKQQALILVAALLLGLSLPVPGSADLLDDCFDGLKLMRDSRADRSCAFTVLSDVGTIRATSEKDVGKCCGMLHRVASQSSDDCACSLRKAFAKRNIDVDKVCKRTLGVTKEKCQAKEVADKAKAGAEKAKADAAQRQVQQREVELSKIGACDRLFQRLDAGEWSKINRDNDIIACREEMQTCGKQ